VSASNIDCSLGAGKSTAEALGMLHLEYASSVESSGHATSLDLWFRITDCLHESLAVNIVEQVEHCSKLRTTEQCASSARPCVDLTSFNRSSKVRVHEEVYSIS
jgi:hypothetical protein